MRFKTTIHSIGTLIALLVLVGLPAAAASGDFHGTNHAASVGIVDEMDIDEVEFRAGRARIVPLINKAKVTLRYDIDLEEGGSYQVDEAILYVRYRDNGDDARVVAKLKRYSLLNGDTETLSIFDSDMRTESDDYRYDMLADYNVSWAYDVSYCYWVEVTLTKKSSAGRPELGMMRLTLREQ